MSCFKIGECSSGPTPGFAKLIPGHLYSCPVETANVRLLYQEPPLARHMPWRKSGTVRLGELPILVCDTTDKDFDESCYQVLIGDQLGWIQFGILLKAGLKPIDL